MVTHSAWVDACGKGVRSVPFELCTAQAHLYSLHVLHRGGPRFWVVIPPLQRHNLELCLLHYREQRYGAAFCERQRPCS